MGKQRLNHIQPEIFQVQPFSRLITDFLAGTTPGNDFLAVTPSCYHFSSPLYAAQGPRHN
jgi:hypothetical protein